MTIELTTREDLINTLHLAAELEHNLMCQYLFAAYTMKRSTSEGLSEVQLEQTRGWGALMTLVARQEMEHMGLVLNLLTAIGGTPYFRRPNFPQRKDRYGKLGIKSELTRFDKETIKRFQGFEAPHPEPGPEFCATRGVVAKNGREGIRALLLAPQVFTPRPAPVTANATGGAQIPQAEIQFTSVQDLYVSLAAGFVTVVEQIGEKSLFIGDANAEIWGGPGTPYGEGSMDDLSQYGLDLIQVVDLKSAIDAIVEIVEQGEGILAPPDYVEHTHYCIYTNMLNDMLNEKPGFDAARPVVRNPLTRMHPDITAPREVNIITRPETREIASLFNLTYETMLLMMLFLYGSSPKTKQLRVDFMNAIFFPLMTMFIRPLSEVLTQLPAFKDKKGNAGPGFELSQDMLVLPQPANIWSEFQRYFDILSWQFDNLWIYELRPADDEIVKRLRYMAENMRRLADDWRARWKNVGRGE
ncbi:MAG TPA: ferritin-like domain-containing protein [Pyrinomonadaceae bacterium]|nr:ferritin-like domain-containing protein [Pyrinomonadaceae bacterium]